MYFSFCGLYPFYILTKTLKDQISGYKKEQIKYIIISLVVIFVAAGMYLSLVLSIAAPPIDNLMVAVFSLITAYAIVRHRLMDITIAVTRASIFIVVYTLVLGVPFVLTVLFRPWLNSVIGVNWWMAPLGLMALLATIGPFIYIYLNKKAEEEILKEQRRYQDTLKRASLGMTRVRDIGKLLKLIVHTVARAVRLNHAAIYILNKAADGYILGSSRGNLSPAQTQTISLNSPLIQHLLDSKSPLLQEELNPNPASPERGPAPKHHRGGVNTRTIFSRPSSIRSRPQ